jgi:serine O-acetyltransferase
VTTHHNRIGLRRLAEDVRTVRLKDPAATSAAEVLLYPHLHALWLHRIAHRAYHRRHRLLARMLSLAGRFLSSGIDIHPGASIGRRLFIDHGVGVVIGETAVLGDDVMLYHGVTIGSAGWWRDRAGERRHPVVGDHVRLCTGASVLGPVVIGAGSEIGAHAVVLTDLPPGSRIAAGSVVRPARRPSPRTNGLPTRRSKG